MGISRFIDDYPKKLVWYMPTLDAVKAVDNLETAVGSKRLGEIFLELGYLSKTELYNALAHQEQKGGRLGWILATLGYVTRLELFEGLARHYHLPFEKSTSYVRKKIDKKLATMLTHEEMIKYQVIPFVLKDDTFFVLTADPDSQSAGKFLHKRFGIETINQVVITDLDLMKLSEELYKDSILDMSINGLLYRNPDESAHKVITRSQMILIAIFICCLAAWLYLEGNSLIIPILYVIQLSYVIPIAFKLTLIIRGKIRHQKIIVDEYDNSFDEYNMPVYTVLIAAYREKEVIGNLVKSIKKLDYPENKLDIILLLEENDPETLEAVKKEKPPASWRFLVLPDSLPKTKPKALNYGLQFAKGKYLTIYDAEDMPEPKQLKKAVAAFKKYPENYICFQAALNYYNKNENFLTKMFTLEYSSWFDCLLPGLFLAGLPIPLGGTSNHFDVQKLKQIGAWDPFNVTEDADLGIRASCKKYKVGVIDSTTYEEANSELTNWIRQRSRWVKGYMQTFLVHSRHPLKSLKSMGFAQWLSYSLLIGGTPVTFLLNPIMWVLFVSSCFVNVPEHINTPVTLFYLATFNLFIGNSLVIFIAMLGVFKRKNYNLIPYAILSPIYWALQSVAAYKGLWQLITKPFYWEKTEHGISRIHPEFWL